MTKFSMVSARLDIELLTSQQRLREAFSKEEVTQAKQLQSQLEGFQEVRIGEDLKLGLLIFGETLLLSHWSSGIGVEDIYR